MNGLIHLVGADAAVRITALLVAHFLADFVFQTRRMVEAKRSTAGLLRHGLVVLAVHVALFVPFLSVRASLFLVGLALSHIIIDRVKIAYETRHGPSLGAFVIDQAAHIALAGWIGIRLADTAVQHFPLPGPSLLVATGLIVAAVAFLVTGGAAVVRLTLDATGVPLDDAGAPAAGRIIGILERLLLFVLVLAAQWAAAGLVLAAKSLARFENLKERPFAEYYLVGTLTSVLVAVLVGIAVAALR